MDACNEDLEELTDIIVGDEEELEEEAEEEGTFVKKKLGYSPFHDNAS